jgi:hypothetical protein
MIVSVSHWLVLFILFERGICSFSTFPFGHFLSRTYV